MAKERKAYTPEQVAEIKRRRDERNAAMRTIVSELLTKTEFSKDELENLRNLARVAAPKNGGRTGDGTTRVSVMSIVSDMFTNVKEIHEDDVFAQHKLGRSEMATATKNIIKKFEPKDRKWIAFDPETGVYTLAGKGENPPKNWTGYVPVEETLADEDEESESEE